MRLSPLLVLLALSAVAGPYAVTAADASPKPSDTNNQPPGATTKPPSPPAPTAAPTPPPGQQPPAASTPAPTPTTVKPSSSPTPTPSNNSTQPASSSAAPTSAPPTTPEPTPTSAPEPTPTPTPPQTASASTTDSTTSSSDSTSSSGMGAGAIVGIVLACVGLVGIIGFFAYRHFRARRDDAQNHHYDAEYGGASPVLESSRGAHDAKMYASLDMPKHSRQTTATATPTDDIVLMTKYATPSSPKFAENPPQLSPPPSSFHHDVADFTKSSTTNFDQSRGPAAASSTEFAHSYREGSYAESYAESYAGGTSFGGGSYMNSFDQGMLGRETFRDTLTDEENATPVAAQQAPSNGLAGLDNGTNDSHWMEAMDEMRGTNDSYAMLEAGGSYNSRGSAMRFSNESDIRG